MQNNIDALTQITKISFLNILHKLRFLQKYVRRCLLALSNLDRIGVTYLT